MKGNSQWRLECRCSTFFSIQHFWVTPSNCYTTFLSTMTAKTQITFRTSLIFSSIPSSLYKINLMWYICMIYNYLQDIFKVVHHFTKKYEGYCEQLKWMRVIVKVETRLQVINFPYVLQQSLSLPLPLSIFVDEYYILETVTSYWYWCMEFMLSPKQWSFFFFFPLESF